MLKPTYMLAYFRNFLPRVGPEVVKIGPFRLQATRRTRRPILTVYFVLLYLSVYVSCCCCCNKFGLFSTMLSVSLVRTALK